MRKAEKVRREQVRNEGTPATSGKGHSRQSADTFDPTKLVFKPLVARTAGQKEVLRQLAENDLQFLVGPAGTGKTYLAVAYALQELKAGRIQKIIACRPAIEAGDSVGYLTGGLVDKMRPYLMPIIDAFESFVGKENVELMVSKGCLELTSLTYLRGRTLNKGILLLDEAQNATCAQLKMVLTRIGEGSTGIVTADPTQCDLEDERASAIHDFYKFEDRPSIGLYTFTKAQIVRSQVVKTVLGAYND